MDRRSFLGSLIGGVAAGTAVRTWPFRVFSFPSTPRLLTKEEITEMYLKPAVDHIFDDFERKFPIGSTVRIRIPQRFVINPTA